MRYDLDKLARALGIELGLPAQPEGARMSDADDGPRGRPLLAETLGVSVSTTHRWSREGLDPYLADHLATITGRRVRAVWPEWVDIEEDELDEDHDEGADGYFADDPPLDQLDATEPARNAA